jgi:hypothetical protein
MQALKEINVGTPQGRLRLTTQRDDLPALYLMPGHRLD